MALNAQQKRRYHHPDAPSSRHASFRRSTSRFCGQDLLQLRDICFGLCQLLPLVRQIAPKTVAFNNNGSIARTKLRHRLLQSILHCRNLGPSCRISVVQCSLGLQLPLGMLRLHCHELILPCSFCRICFSARRGERRFRLLLQLGKLARRCLRHPLCLCKLVTKCRYTR